MEQKQTVNNGEGTAGRLLNDKKLYESLNKTVLQIEAITNEIRAGKGTAARSLTTMRFTTKHEQR